MTKTEETMMRLEDHVKAHEDLGCQRRDIRHPMPDGYALMLDHDEMYYYWLRHDGSTSEVHWNKWAVRKGAIANSKKIDI